MAFLIYAFNILNMAEGRRAGSVRETVSAPAGCVIGRRRSIFFLLFSPGLNVPLITIRVGATPAIVSGIFQVTSPKRDFHTLPFEIDLSPDSKERTSDMTEIQTIHD